VKHVTKTRCWHSIQCWGRWHIHKGLFFK